MIENKEITMQFHPRAFSAFGSDLVTNDSVAVTELVKNCYDAFAYNAAVAFDTETDGHQYIEIADDGLGMTQDVISSAWAVIATPYKKRHPSVTRKGVTRIVSGNKGLGRFSAARLGDTLQIFTKSNNDTCFCATLNWLEFENAESISDCKISISEYSWDKLCGRLRAYFFSDSSTGTIIKISSLHKKWQSDDIETLKLSLARLVSPFEQVKDFNLFLFDGSSSDASIKIQPHEFIRHPLYCLSGNVDDKGNIHWTYQYAPKGKVSKTEQNVIEWKDGRRGFDRIVPSLEFEDGIKPYKCGSFSFEIRAWDLDSDSIADIKDVFNVPRNEIRKTISKYKGISVYRDNVLVLPKSDSSKDWLGVDIRRVSALGKRLSTSQIVGILSISSKNNPGLKDTTDREKLVDTEEFKQFCKLAETIISTLENHRNIDKIDNLHFKERTLVNLLAPLSASTLESNLELMMQEGKGTEDILDAVREYRENSEKTLNELNERLIYYAQTASLGSVAVIIMHEIRTGMTVIKRFLRKIAPSISNSDSRTVEYFNDAENSHKRLLEVADSFAPLYRKDLAKKDAKTNILKSINNGVRLVRGKKEYDNIDIQVDVSENFYTTLHTGELQTIVINLVDNACYWIHQTKKTGTVKISCQSNGGNKAEINVSDNGPGIKPEDAEKIFEPGITAKPQGIGMGLVIVTELLNNHKSRIKTIIPGDLNGATFVFDLPVIHNGGES